MRYKNEILNSYKIEYYPYQKTHITFKKRMSIAAQMWNSSRKTIWSSLQPPGEKTGIMKLNFRLLLATLCLSHWKKCVCKHGITPLYQTNIRQLTQYKTSTEWEIGDFEKSTYTPSLHTCKHMHTNTRTQQVHAHHYIENDFHWIEFKFEKQLLQ